VNLTGGQLLFLLYVHFEQWAVLMYPIRLPPREMGHVILIALRFILYLIANLLNPLLSHPAMFVVSPFSSFGNSFISD
jgi:hypothetical protein